MASVHGNQSQAKCPKICKKYFMNSSMREERRFPLTIENNEHNLLSSAGEAPKRSELRTGEVRIMQIQKFNCLGSVITEDRKGDIEIRSNIGIT